MFKVYIQNSIFQFGLSIDLGKKNEKKLILVTNSYKILTIQNFTIHCFLMHLDRKLVAW